MATSIEKLGRQYGMSGVKMPRWKHVINTLLPLLIIFGFCLFFKGIDSCPHAAYVIPNTGIQGQALTVVITDPAATDEERTFLNDIDFGPGITVLHDWVITSPTTIRVNIVIAPTAPLGSRDVISTYAGGTQYSLANAFTVVEPPTPFIHTGVTSHGSSMSSNSVIGSQAPVSLPVMAVQSASLSASKVSPGTPVTVNAVIANTGAVNGTMNVKLFVNGKEDAARGVALDSGKSLPVTFDVTRSQPGTYTVYVGGMSAGSFTVDELNDGNTILIISLSLIAVALMIGVIILVRRKQHISQV